MAASQSVEAAQGLVASAVRVSVSAATELAAKSRSSLREQAKAAQCGHLLHAPTKTPPEKAILGGALGGGPYATLARGAWIGQGG